MPCRRARVFSAVGRICPQAGSQRSASAEAHLLGAWRVDHEAGFKQAIPLCQVPLSQLHLLKAGRQLGYLPFASLLLGLQVGDRSVRTGTV